MVLKQASRMTCLCGRDVIFPEGEIQTKCQAKGCKAVWTCGAEGFWSVLAPILPKPKAKKPNHYNNYMKRRSKGYGVGNGIRVRV